MSTVDCTFQNLRTLQDKIIELGSCLSSVKPISPKESNKAYLDYLWNTRIKTYLSDSGKDNPQQEKLKIFYREWENIRDNLAIKYMHLVLKIAKKFGHPNQDYNDLVQEGAKGLLRAIDSYNPDQGVPFEGFAPYWIRKYISSLVESNSDIIRIPDSAVRKRRTQEKNVNGLLFEKINTEKGEEIYSEEDCNPEQQLALENQKKIEASSTCVEAFRQLC